ncbi:uncharacterized protein FIESC28_06986 [Fusarium coffeatum]|uniref:Redoxin domain-containing protein n=1 Tax=Fusarium coffeatum TaxID=231269 RepID=A0A366RIU5_9HYPO|nr:uncharacterized protein FIESC28_06986 [Fusarium coffeatum]RBR16438.1 hypothetical protein FIESC28_06986 [Fusarium coffeatum]
MSGIKAGDDFPQGVFFSYIQPSPEIAEFSTCGAPTNYNASEEFKNKKVVLVSVPGAFTPTCSGSHVPSYVENIDKIKAKGVDQVILFMSDHNAKFSSSIGWNLGERTGRFALIVDHGKVVYASKDDDPKSIEQSGALGVLAHL